MNRSKRMRFGARLFLRSQEPFNNIIRRAQLCEKLGFDSVFVDDHLLYGTSEASAPDPFTTLTAITVQTKKIEAGILVTDLVRRHPGIVAQAASTIAAIAPGRIFLGLGAGDPMNQAPFGIPTDNRYSKLREGVDVLKTLWSSSIEKPANLAGQFFSLKNAYLQTGPSENQGVPIYLAAFGRKMLELTGQKADGWIPHCHNQSTYRQDLRIILEAAQKIGRRQADFLPCYYTLASTSRSQDQANKRVRGPARYFLALIPEALRKVDPDAQHPGRIWEKMTLPSEQRETIRKIASTIPEDTALNTVIHGKPEECIEQIAGFQKAGCTELMLTFVADEGLWSAKGLTSSIRFFANRVMSYFS